MLMLDVPVTVPLAGLHDAVALVAVTDAVGLEFRFWTDCIAMATSEAESPTLS